MVSDPEEAAPPCLSGCADVDFHQIDGVVLPVSLITGLNPFNLSVYGLRARWPTLRCDHYCSPPKVSLLGGWLGLPRWASHPLDYPVLPGRSNISSLGFLFLERTPSHLGHLTGILFTVS
jgi:hypothetical protein